MLFQRSRNAAHAVANRIESWGMRQWVAAVQHDAGGLAARVRVDERDPPHALTRSGFSVTI